MASPYLEHVASFRSCGLYTRATSLTLPTLSMPYPLRKLVNRTFSLVKPTSISLSKARCSISVFEASEDGENGLRVKNIPTPATVISVF